MLFKFRGQQFEISLFFSQILFLYSRLLRLSYPLWFQLSLSSLASSLNATLSQLSIPRLSLYRNLSAREDSISQY